MQKAIILFTKPPIFGKSKTRLSKHLGKKDTLALSENLIKKNYNYAKNHSWDLFVYSVPELNKNPLKKITENTIYTQKGNDLGERMINAFDDVLSQNYSKVLLMGSDIADIDENIIATAFESLDKNDITISKTRDGGYSLIGMKQLQKDLFLNREFSHENVYNEFIDTAKKNNLKVYNLRDTYDIDDIYDLIYHINGEDDCSIIGKGQYNTNVLSKGILYRFARESQMDLDNQIGYEYSALEILNHSGVTPKVYGLYEDKLTKVHYLTEEYCKGRHLNYDTDIEIAAYLLSKIHSQKIPANNTLIKVESGFSAMYDEFEKMFSVYESSEYKNENTAKKINELLNYIKSLGLEEKTENPCIINTELNNENFLINDEKKEKSVIVDWEKPLIGDREQDIAHFLAPTTTFWKTDKIFSTKETDQFIKEYNNCSEIKINQNKLKKYLAFTCLRGITWCSMAYVQHIQRDMAEGFSFEKIKAYLTDDFLYEIWDYIGEK